MKNSKLQLSEHWEVIVDEFYEIDPEDRTIVIDRKLDELFQQENLLLLKNGEYHLDLGWYGGEEQGAFVLYLYHGDDWHDCELQEKRTSRNYEAIIAEINQLASYVDRGVYDEFYMESGSIDDHLEIDYYSASEIVAKELAGDEYYQNQLQDQEDQEAQWRWENESL